MKSRSVPLRYMTALICAVGMGAVLSAGVAAAQAQKVLKFIPQADLRILDPITTTAYITRNHGYMIYDTLFAIDAKFQVQPQMVDKYEHQQGQADLHVHAARRTQVPRRHAGALGRLHRVDRALGEARRAGPEAGGSRPSRGRPSTTRPSRSSSRSRSRSRSRRWRSRRRTCRSSCPSASPRPTRSPTSPSRSAPGPFKFVKEEWVPGSKVVYVKNTDYVPRKEPPSWAAGGKVVKVDRVEWIYIPDSATAAAALNAGEVDWWEQMPPDLIPVLAKNKDIKVENIDPLGSMGVLRFNFLYPPFNNQKMRQAMLYAIDQNDYVLGIAGDAKNGHTCYSYFTCGTPLSSEVGAEPLKGKRDFEKAKQLIKEAGYKGEKIVIIDGDRSADRALAIAADRGDAAQARPQRRLAGGRLGHADHAPHVEGAGRQGRLVDLPHLARRPRRDLAGGQFRDSRHGPERRGSAGRTTRRSRSCATRGSRRPMPRARRRPPMRCRCARSSSCPTSRPAQFILPTAYRTNLSRRDHRADHAHVERREEIAASAARRQPPGGG